LYEVKSENQLKQGNTFEGIVSFFRQEMERLPDKRTGKNTRYEMLDAALIAFSVFFTQSPSFLATLNILSLLFHTLLELLDSKYQLIRAHLPSRKTFFDDLRALTRYLCFDSWDHLLAFMLDGLDLLPPPNSC
jgi:hypothetical protein